MASRITEYIYITLYLPDDPIGFVKSFEDLVDEVKKHFEIVNKIVNETDNSIFLLARKISDKE